MNILNNIAGVACALALLAPLSAVADSETLGNKLLIDKAVVNQIVGDASTVIFGEDSHGMYKVHQLVPQLFQHLVEEKGFRVFVFESFWGLTRGFEDFMNSERTEVNSLESYWLNGTFSSAPIDGMLVWIREWNRKHPNDRIQLRGYQPENPVYDFAELLPFIDKVAGDEAADLRKGVKVCRAADPKYKTELDFLIAGFERRKEKKPFYTDKERADCLNGVAAIAKYLDDNAKRIESSTGYETLTLANLHVTSLKAYAGVIKRAGDLGIAETTDVDSVVFSTLAQNMGYHLGDETRFKIYNTLQELYFADKKVFHWMHNWHGFRNTDEVGELPGEAGIPRSTYSFGTRVAKALGDDVKVIGNFVICTEEGSRPCTEREDSLETQFKNKFGSNIGWVDFNNAEQVKGLSIDTLGTLYANYHQFGWDGVVLERQMDGAVYLPETITIYEAKKQHQSE